VALALLWASSGTAPAFEPAEAMRAREARVRGILEARVAAGEAPGIQYSAVSRAAVLFEGAAGIADLAVRRPMEPSTTTMIYSMTKTFTAVAVLQLIERGALSLDAPVKGILPEIPYDARLTVRHLLAQTSGIPNPLPLKWVHLPEEHATYDERARLAAILKDSAELRFAPGTRYAYSNISYWLLGRVVEKVSGTPFADRVTAQVFRRLELPPEEAAFVIPARERHARGYLPRWSFMNLVKGFLIDDRFVGEVQGSWVQVNDNYLDGAAFGGIVASGRAVARFLQDLLAAEPRLLGPEGRRLLLEQQRNGDGEPVETTLGWHVGSGGGPPFLFKEGGGAGFHGEMRLYPSAGIASVAVANNASFDVKGFLAEIDRELTR